LPPFEISGKREREARKPSGEMLRKDVDVIRPAEMQEIQQNFCMGFGRGVQNQRQRIKFVSARYLFDQMPPSGNTNGANSESTNALVIF